MSCVLILRSSCGAPCFSFEVFCEGSPCRAIPLYDSSTEKTVVRFISKKPGALVFKFRNLGRNGSTYFNIFKADLRPGEKWSGQLMKTRINLVNLLEVSQGYDLVRDVTTEREIKVELLKDEFHKLIKDGDVEKMKYARTKFRMTVAPCDDAWDYHDWDLKNGTWTIHNLRDGEWPIYVEKRGSRTVFRTLCGTATFRDMKQAVGTLISEGDKLMFGNRHVLRRDCETLSTCGIPPFATVRVVPCGCFYMFYVNLQGKPVSLNVCKYYLVENLKEIISETEGIPCEQQRLMYGGKQLEDGHCVGEYDIHVGATIHLSVRIKGGLATKSREFFLPKMDMASGSQAKLISVVGIKQKLVDPGELIVGKIVSGKKLEREETCVSLIEPFMSMANDDLQFEVYIDLN